MPSSTCPRPRRTIAILYLVLFVMPVLATVEASVAIQASAPVIGQPFPIADAHPNTEDWASVAYDEDRRQFLVVHHNDGSINATCLSATGSTIATYVLGNGDLSDVAYNKIDDQYMVVFADSGTIEGNTVSGSCCQNVGCAGVPFTISDRPSGTDQYEPAIAYNQHASHHDYLVVWTSWTNAPPLYPSVYARRFNADRTFDAGSFAVADDSVTYEHSYEPDVAYNLNRNEWLIVYTRDAAGTGVDRNIFGRRYFANGDTLESSEGAIDPSSDNQSAPAVAAYRLNASNPYLVVFTDFWDDTSGDVRGYLVDGDGAPTTLVNLAVTPGRAEETADIASSEGLGGYTVVWTESGSTLESMGAELATTAQQNLHSRFPYPQAQPTKTLLLLPEGHRTPWLSGNNGSRAMTSMDAFWVTPSIFRL